jgi:hypothetical protein
VFSATYVGNQNRHQNDYRETNLPSPSILPCLIQGDKSCPYNTVVPYRGFNSLKIAENAGNGHYNGLQLELRARIRQDLTLQTAYTYSRAIDITGSVGSFGGDLQTLSNPYDRAYDYGPSGGDRTHIAFVNFIYQLPFFKNAQSRVLKTTLGGWEMSGIVTMQSGLPLHMTLGGTQGSNGLANATNRPDSTGNVSYPQKVSEWFDTSGFSTPALGA